VVSVDSSTPLPVAWQQLARYAPAAPAVVAPQPDAHSLPGAAV
jgi:hypothetical protein